MSALIVGAGPGLSASLAKKLSARGVKVETNPPTQSVLRSHTFGTSSSLTALILFVHACLIVELELTVSNARLGMY